MTDFIQVSPVFPPMTFILDPGSSPGHHIAFST